MSVNTMYAIVRSGPILDACKKYRMEYEKAHATISRWSSKLGAEAYIAWPGHSVSGLRFPSGAKIPAGWNKPNSKNISVPMKKNNQKVWDAIAKLPIIPNPVNFLGSEFFPRFIELNNPKTGGSASAALARARMTVPFIGWAGKTFIIEVPDVIAELKHFRKEYPAKEGWRIVGDITKWVLPEGVEIITATHKEYIYAKNKYDEERTAERKKQRSLAERKLTRATKIPKTKIAN